MTNLNNQLSRIPVEWRMTQGDNTFLGIIDTNIDDREYIINKRLFGYNDNKKHSESVLGIILDKSIKGLANKTKVNYAGIAMDSSTYDNFVDALEWISKFELDVLNLSLAYKDDYVRIKALLQEISKRTLVICAYSDSLKYPHSYDFTVAVGNKANQVADIVISDVLGRRDEQFRGSSMSCAFVSSIACLAKSHDKNISKDEFINRINGNRELEIKSMYDNRGQHNIVL